jgi:hypothetical protein
VARTVVTKGLVFDGMRPPARIPRHQPGPALRHLIEIRNPTWTAPAAAAPLPDATSTTSPPTTTVDERENAT